LSTFLGEKESLAIDRVVIKLAELVWRERTSVLFGQLMASVLAVLLTGALMLSFGFYWSA